MDQWHVIVSGEPRGPLSFRELADLANHGTLKSTDKVWRQDWADWVEAGEVVGLFHSVPPEDLTPAVSASERPHGLERHPSMENSKSENLRTIKRNENFIIRHWRGNFSLPRSYWINSLISNIFIFVLFILSSQEVRHVRNLYIPIASLLFFWGVVVVVLIWQLVGTWRSANRASIENPKSIWPNIAKFMMVLATLKFGADFVKDAPVQFEDAYQAAIGDPAMGKRGIRVLADGTEIEISGPMARGQVEAFSDALVDSPRAHLIHLDSLGGRISVAEDIADIISGLGLDTLVDNRCASACTIVFLAGHRRWIRPSAKMGFHSGSFAGKSGSLFNETFKLYYKSAGLPQTFIDRALGTPANSIWVPTTEELLAAHVVTDIADENSFALAGMGPKPTATSAMALLETIPVYVAIKKIDPNNLEPIEEAWREVILGGEPVGKFQALLHERIRNAASMLKPVAPDDTILELGALLIQEAAAVQAVDPEDCWEILYRGHGDISKYLSQELEKRDQAATQRLLVETPAARVRRTSRDEGRRLIGIALGNAKAAGTDPSAIINAFRGESPHEQFCPAFIALYEAAENMPRPEGAKLLRYLSDN